MGIDDGSLVVRDKKSLITLMILVFAVTLIDGLDSSIVSLTLPTISKDLGCSIADSSWLLNAYILGIAAPLFAFAKIADGGKIKELFVYGVFVFTAASLFCGLSTSYIMLVVSRLVQGIGASMMGATAPIIVVRMMPENMRGRGMSVLALATGAAAILGPTVGSFIATALSWHYIFYINIPIGIVLIIAGMIVLPKVKTGWHDFSPDLLSIIYVGGFISTVLVVLENTACNSLPMWVFVVCIVLAILFLVLMVRRLNRSDIKNKLVDVGIFKNMEFILVGLSFLFTTMMAAGSEYLLPYYMQGPCQISQIECGLYMMILSVATIVMAVITGKWCDAKGCKTPTVIAIILRIAFSSMFIFILPSWGVWSLVVALFIMGVSFGISGTSQSTRMIQHADEKHKGEASAVMLEVNYIGAALGTVAYAMMFSISGKLESGSNTVIIDGFHFASVLGVILAILALICTLRVRNIVPKNEA